MTLQKALLLAGASALAIAAGFGSGLLLGALFPAPTKTQRSEATAPREFDADAHAKPEVAPGHKPEVKKELSLFEKTFGLEDIEEEPTAPQSATNKAASPLQENGLTGADRGDQPNAPPPTSAPQTAAGENEATLQPAAIAPASAGDQNEAVQLEETPTPAATGPLEDNP